MTAKETSPAIISDAEARRVAARYFNLGDDSVGGVFLEDGRIEMGEVGNLAESISESHLDLFDSGGSGPTCACALAGENCDLNLLRLYVLHHGERGPVEGWGETK